jgi:mono/diheme cytochrome c family protein
MLRGVCLCSAVVFVSCSPVNECPAVSDTSLARAPATLAETGLFAAASPETLGDGVRAYKPRFELWSDGAKKRRWIRLPPGTQIDGSDPDAWQFPVGTRLWKEFAFDGRRVETRYMERFDDGWLFVSYAWNDDGTEATQLAQGGKTSASGSHVIPAADQCFGCHGGRASRVLGFSAIQLAQAPEGLTTRQLFDAGLLTPEPPELQLPGDDTAQAGLGYLHANCSHCHNQTRPMPGKERCWDPLNDLDFSLRANSLGSVSATAAFKTISQHERQILNRLGRTAAEGGMPPLAKDVVDTDGAARVKAFVDSL